MYDAWQDFDIRALGRGEPFHQILEKGPILVFDGRHGNRLCFYEAKNGTEISFDLLKL